MLKIISIILKRSGIAASAVLLLGISQASLAGIPEFDDLVGDLGHEKTFSSGLKVNAWGDIDPAFDGTAFFGGPDTSSDGSKGCLTNSGDEGGKSDATCRGEIYISTAGEGKDKDPKDGYGMGVREYDPNTGGSLGISGKGEQENESLVFDFSKVNSGNVKVNEISFLLTGWDGSGLDDGDKDRGILYVEGGGIFDIGGNWDGDATTDYLTCTRPGAYECSLSLASLGGAAATRIEIRAAYNDAGDAEFKVGGVSYGGTPDPIPVPAAFWLFGTAIFGLIGMRRKAKLAA